MKKIPPIAWIIGIILVVFLMKGNLNLFSIGGGSNWDECLAARGNYRQSGYQCVGPCVEFTPTIQACLGQQSIVWHNEQYGFYYFGSQTCQQAYQQDSGSAVDSMNCLYGGLPNPIPICQRPDTFTTDHSWYYCADRTVYSCNGFVWQSAYSCGDLVCAPGSQVPHADGSNDCIQQQCNTFADTNCDGTVSRAELGAAITQWISNSITRAQLGTAIQAWVAG